MRRKLDSNYRKPSEWALQSSWLRFAQAMLLLLLMTACGNTSETVESGSKPAPLDESSLYQLTSNWHSHLGDTVQLADLRGRQVVMAMVFTHCPFACPRIVADMQQIEQQVPADKREEVLFVLVSFDTERDQPERLREFAREMELGDNWLLLHGGEMEVRELSMLLGVSYKQQSGGDFAHSNLITLLDTQGTQLAAVEGLGASAKPILEKIGE